MTADEVPALVLECGSYSTKAGYTSEDTPRAVFSSNVGVLSGGGGGGGGDVEMIDGSAAQTTKYYGDSATLCRESMEIKSAFDPNTGLVNDWDLYEGLWEYSFSNRMRIRPEEFPLLLVEPSQNTAEQRAKQAELAFEKYKIPAMFMARTGVLSAFAAGRSTGLVVDVGAAHTTISPVYDGYVVKKAVKSQPVGGNLITAQLLQYLSGKLEIDLTPQHRILRKKPVDEGQPPEYTVRPKMPALTDSFEQAAIHRVVNDFKETVCTVSDIRYDERTLTMRPQKSYEFPTGFNKLFSANRFFVPEILFNPKDYFMQPPSPSSSLITTNEGLVGIQSLIVESVSACDVDLRPQLLSNIVLTGGSTLFQNFGERINNELFSTLPGSKIRVYASGNSTERRFGSWIGGSILGSLGTFHQLWVSKQEYEENGASILEKRCQ